MMHLAKAAPQPRLRACRTHRTGQRASASCSRQRDAQYLVSRYAGSLFRSPGANFLEFISAAFHYSVISRVDVARLEAGFSSIARRLFPRSGEWLHVLLHKEMMDDAPTSTCQFRFRTGDRKIDANGFESVAR
jgi:hypothetical protein